MWSEKKNAKIDKHIRVRVIPQGYYKFPKDPNQRGKVGESMLKFYYVIENAGKFNFSYTLFINVIHFSVQSSFFSFVLFFQWLLKLSSYLIKERNFPILELEYNSSFLKVGNKGRRRDYLVLYFCRTEKTATWYVESIRIEIPAKKERSKAGKSRYWLKW